MQLLQLYTTNAIYTVTVSVVACCSSSLVLHTCTTSSSSTAAIIASGLHFSAAIVQRFE
jgi:hypothetical protein